MNSELTKNGLRVGPGPASGPHVELTLWEAEMLRRHLNSHKDIIAASGVEVSPEPARLPLFQRGQFTLASGKKSSWKIECDALTKEDWEGLAEMAVMTVLKGMTIAAVMGVPRGGVPFSDAVVKYVTQPAPLDSVIVLCEDVVTTGGSITRFRDKYCLDWGLPVVGVCVFARGRCPDWVKPLFRMPEDATP